MTSLPSLTPMADNDQCLMCNPAAPYQAMYTFYKYTASLPFLTPMADNDHSSRPASCAYNVHNDHDQLSVTVGQVNTQEALSNAAAAAC